MWYVFFFFQKCQRFCLWSYEFVRFSVGFYVSLFLVFLQLRTRGSVFFFLCRVFVSIVRCFVVDVFVFERVDFFFVLVGIGQYVLFLILSQFVLIVFVSKCFVCWFGFYRRFAWKFGFLRTFFELLLCFFVGKAVFGVFWWFGIGWYQFVILIFWLNVFFFIR